MKTLKKLNLKKKGNKMKHVRKTKKHVKKTRKYVKKTKKHVQKKYMGGEGDNEESNTDKLYRLEEELEEAKKYLQKTKNDWNEAAKNSHAQPDYYWVEDAEYTIKNLEEEIEKVKKLLEEEKMILK